MATEAPTELQRVIPPDGTISLARGVPTADVFPVAELADCARAILEREGRTVLNYGAPCGYEPLREWIAERHGVPAARVIVTPGSLLGLNVVVRSLLGRSPGRSAAVVESPTYDRMLRILAALGAEIRPVPRDEQGLDLDALERAFTQPPRPAFLYTMPTFHNPSGRTLDRRQREAVLALASAHGVAIVEDDPYGAVRFAGEPEPSVLELAVASGQETAVVASSSFSKTVSPGLRVGYVIAPGTLATTLEAELTDLYVSPPIAPQAQLYEFLARGNFEPNLERVRAVLGVRHNAMRDALASNLPAATWTTPGGGYFLWLDFPPGVDADALLERARSRGVTFVPGSGFFSGAGGEASARLAFSYPSVDEIREGVARLGRLVRETMG